MGAGQDASYGYTELNSALPLHCGQNVTEMCPLQSVHTVPVDGRVRRDELYFLDRCGFDSLQLPVGVDPTDALKAFDEITVHY